VHCDGAVRRAMPDRTQGVVAAGGSVEEAGGWSWRSTMSFRAGAAECRRRRDGMRGREREGEEARESGENNVATMSVTARHIYLRPRTVKDFRKFKCTVEGVSPHPHGRVLALAVLPLRRQRKGSSVPWWTNGSSCPINH
jgi:hypothetical protein